MEDLIQTIAVYAIPVLLAITLHEAAHGYVARMFGDSTAWMLGRVTLNPLKHVDPVGTVLVPGVILLTSALAGAGGMLFGWAKPVPVNFANLRHPKRDMIWVAAAGPGSNLLQAILWALLLKLMLVAGVEERFVYLVAQAGISVNLVLMALNLLPLPPLDGGRILVGLLPPGPSQALARVEPYGFFILIALLVTGTLGVFLRPFLAVGDAIVRVFL
ncbi:MAG TPA: site-2 protease family protein [Burkholderiaceae bacterium]|nr:site-2 protease family protein [Burkholderiaceae bacterium]HRZ01505.1 site-2 protease family protein [Burkholderiaceae bacterium]